MPPAIIDSEDEEDEILLDDHLTFRKPTDQSLHHVTRFNGGADDQGTGSTDRLMVQLQNAAQSLCDEGPARTSMPNMSTTVMSSLLEPLKTKRRHTSECASSQIQSPARLSKRAKTAKATSPIPSTVDQNAGPTSFATMLSWKSSDMAHPSPAGLGEHSTAKPPLSTLEENFLHHEPTIMFRNTGSTIPDNESTQQRLLEQAIAGKQDSHDGPVIASMKSNAHGSSSFPWSIDSTPNCSANLIVADPDHSQTDDQNQILEDSEAIMKELNMFAEHGVGHSQIHGDSDSGGVNLQPHAESRQLLKEVLIPPASLQTTKVMKCLNPASSPDVLDHTSEVDKTIVQHPTSEDADIGLPKELYNPRPSRRRSAFMADEPIDYSVVPEKAAKKRRKAAHDSGTSLSLDESPETSKRPRRKLDQSKLDVSSEEVSADVTDADVIVLARDGEPANQCSAIEIHSLVNAEVIQSQKTNEDSEVFKLPAKPASSSTTRRTRRHHTTIFEDHIDFVGSQRSPSLKQQQANRKLALKDAQSDSLRSSQRTRKSIVVDDDNTEDELAGEITIVNTSPKKRGRPRKSKGPDPKDTAQVKKASKNEYAEIEAEDDRAESHEREESPEKQVEVDLQPKEPSHEITILEGVASDVARPQDCDAVKHKAVAPPQVIPEPSKEASKEPFKEPANDVKQSKGSPTSHSPINNHSKVPLRVGLSRHQRIPSLLRVVRPVKR